jgi:maltooligosyltrehalose synthase
MTTPNEAYFAHADMIVDMAAKKGMLVFLVPAYLGWNGGDEGWYQDILRAGKTRLRQYGRYVDYGG